jgi:hypothetical protein
LGLAEGEGLGLGDAGCIEGVLVGICALLLASAPVFSEELVLKGARVLPVLSAHAPRKRTGIRTKVFISGPPESFLGILEEILRTHSFMFSREFAASESVFY